MTFQIGEYVDMLGPEEGLYVVEVVRADGLVLFPSDQREPNTAHKHGRITVSLADVIMRSDVVTVYNDGTPLRAHVVAPLGTPLECASHDHYVSAMQNARGRDYRE